MLTIIDRYILRETLRMAFLGLLVFTFLLTLEPIMSVAEPLISKGVDGWTIAKLMVMLIPQGLGVTIPMAVLIGLLVVFLTRLTSFSCVVCVMVARLVNTGRPEEASAVRIIFYVDHRFPNACRIPVPPAMQADHSGDVTDCYAKLGVEIVRIGYGLDNAFGRATQNHTIQRIGKWANGAPRAVVPEFLTDLVRLYALRQVGGFYFDSDVFVTSPELRQWRRAHPFT